MTALDQFAQIGLLVFSLSGMFLVARKNKWGFVLGLLSQPFWFITACINNQWGIFVNSFIYSIIWIYGIYNWFQGERLMDKQGEKR